MGSNRLEVSSELPEGASYSIFKEGIFPGWEDPRNQDGGRWIISLNSNSKFLDTKWLEIVLFLIGEHADQHAHQINGAVVCIRQRGYAKLEVWLADASHKESILNIGRQVKEILRMDSSSTIYFSVHKDKKFEQRKRPERSKPRYRM